MFISFEGIDGAGKSTQVKLFSDRLREDGIEVVNIKEPGGVELYDELRDILLYRDYDQEPLARFFMFASGRIQLVKDVVVPALIGGKVVIADRFFDSSMAYQILASGYHKAYYRNREFANQINKISAKNIIPHMTFLIDVDPKKAYERLQTRGGASDNIEKRGMEYLVKVREAYVDISVENAKRFYRIDGEFERGFTHDIIYKTFLKELSPYKHQELYKVYKEKGLYK